MTIDICNHEVPEFADATPTTENIAVAIWRRWMEEFQVRRCIAWRVYEMDDLLRTSMARYGVSKKGSVAG